MIKSETERISERYARRAALGLDNRYSMLRPEVWLAVQERQRAIIRLLGRHASKPLKELRLLEIGCGSGSNTLDMIRLGFMPENLVANELLPERVAIARQNLSDATALLEGDATNLLFEEGFDIVLQSTVFTSLLDDRFQAQLAAKMWRWIEPRGGVLWYDSLWISVSLG